MDNYPIQKGKTSTGYFKEGGLMHKIYWYSCVAHVT